jgi:hypothetical protein
MVTEAGAIDGLLGRPSPTVDGVPWPEYAGVLEELAAL